MRQMTLAFLFLLFSWSAKAETLCNTSSNSYQDVLLCMESLSPEVHEARLEQKQASARVLAAGQWKNPELSLESFPRTSAVTGETDISLALPFSLGGEISAKSAVAKGFVSLAEAKLYSVRAKIRTEAMMKMHRLRQALHEKDVVDEAIQTFSKLVKQYAKRPGLSPEQKVSFSVFQLSKSEYELKKLEIVEEILSLESFFYIRTNWNREQIKRILPHSIAWPNSSINLVKNGNELSPQARVLQAEVEIAQANLNLAQSNAWPTLALGPSLKMEHNPNQTNSVMGFNVGFSLPIFSLNRGEKAVAASGLGLSEARKEIELRKLSLRREELYKIYELSIGTLSSSMSHQEIEKRHSEGEQLFLKGMVPSSLVIEAHRMSFDLEKIRHERELKALGALLELYAMNGKILEVNL